MYSFRSHWHKPSTPNNPVYQAHLPNGINTTQATLVPQQDNLFYHITKTAQEQPKECHTELKAPTWPQIALDLNLTELHNTCLKNSIHIQAELIRGFTLKLYLGEFIGSKNFHINTNVIHIIWPADFNKVSANGIVMSPRLTLFVSLFYFQFKAHLMAFFWQSLNVIIRRYNHFRLNLKCVSCLCVQIYAPRIFFFFLH